MYKEVEIEICDILEEKSIKLRPSILEQVVLPSVFHKEEYIVLRARKVNATISDRSISRDHHLIQLEGVVLP